MNWRPLSPSRAPALVALQTKTPSPHKTKSASSNNSASSEKENVHSTLTLTENPNPIPTSTTSIAISPNQLAPPTVDAPETKEEARKQLFDHSKQGLVSQVDQLLSSHSQWLSVTDTDDQGWTLLHWATYCNSMTLIQYLLTHLPPALSRKEFVNQPGGGMDATALHWACKFGYSQTAVYLIENEGDPFLRDGQGFCCLHLAVQCKNRFLIAYLMASQPELIKIGDSQQQTPLHWAAYQGEQLESSALEKVRRFTFYEQPLISLLLVPETILDGQDLHGMTPLQWACGKGNLLDIQFLLQAGANDTYRVPQREVKNVVPPSTTTLDFSGRPLNEVGFPIGLSPKELLQWCRPKEGALEYENIKSYIQGHSPFTTYFGITKRQLIFGSLPALEMSFFLTMMTFTQWFIAVPVSLFCCFTSLYLIQKFYLGEENDFMDTPIVSGIVQASIVIACSNYLFFVLPTMFMSNVLLHLFCVAFSSLSAWSLYRSIVDDPGYLKKKCLADEREQVVQLAAEGRLDGRYFCMSCLVRKTLRSKHCRFCGRCVARLDHHCPWTNNCIGAQNHRQFCTFIVSLAVGIGLLLESNLSYLSTSLAQIPAQLPLFPEDYPCYLGDTMCGYFSIAPVTVSICLWSGFQLFWLLFLVCTQLYYIASSLTTNESVNYERYDYLLDESPSNFRGHVHRDYKNPFDGGWIRNCITFWSDNGKKWLHVYRPSDVMKIEVEKNQLLPK